MTIPLKNLTFALYFFSGSFLQSCGNSTVATTWHSYSVDGKNATADNFTDPILMDVVKSEIKEVQRLIQKYRPFLPKSWIGETAGAYGGGAPGLSNAYAGGFLYVFYSDNVVCCIKYICIPSNMDW